MDTEHTLNHPGSDRWSGGDKKDAEVGSRFSVLADREAELLELKGPCSSANCRLHYAHRGPCDIRKAHA